MGYLPVNVFSQHEDIQRAEVGNSWLFSKLCLRHFKNNIYKTRKILTILYIPESCHEAPFFMPMHGIEILLFRIRSTRTEFRLFDISRN